MKIDQLRWTEPQGWQTQGSGGRHAVAGSSGGAQLILYFADPEVLTQVRLSELAAKYPDANLVGCTTGGEILDREVHEKSIVAVALAFDATKLSFAAGSVADVSESSAIGQRLGRELMQPDLRAVFVLSDGTRVNGSELVAGFRKALGADVVLTGGLAGDGARFGTTRVGTGSNPAAGNVVAIGLSGQAIRIGHGCVGGWEAFGPERLITRSIGNVLYELDGQPALDLYKKYLGAEAAKLPGSALLFPLCLRRSGDHDADLVRTIVGVDENLKTMTFAGDVPEGGAAQLMRGSISRLVTGASEAAEQAAHGENGGASSEPSLGLLVSCIGRKLLMGQRVSDEVEAAADALGAGCKTIGFYSYGEISPHAVTGKCDLHNQTMTITTLREEC